VPLLIAGIRSAVEYYVRRLGRSNVSEETLDFCSKPVRSGCQFPTGFENGIGDAAGLTRSVRDTSHAR
jgi:hypothetical protein